MGTFTQLLWLALIIWGVWELVQYFRRRDAATALENEEFTKSAAN